MKKDNTNNAPKEMEEEKKVSREVTSQELEQVVGGALQWRSTGSVVRR